MIKRGQYVTMSYDENIHIVIRTNRSGDYMLHRIDKPYSEKYIITVHEDHIKEVSILQISVSKDFMKHMKDMWNLKGEFEFETRLLKSWDLASNFQYDFIHMYTQTAGEHVFISYKHMCNIRRSNVVELVPGKTITNYEYLHKFRCKKLWKTNSRALLRASR